MRNRPMEYTVVPGEGNDHTVVNLVTSDNPTARLWRLLLRMGRSSEKQLLAEYERTYGACTVPSRGRLLRLTRMGWVSEGKWETPAVPDPGTEGVRPRMTYVAYETQRKVRTNPMTPKQKISAARRRLLILAKRANDARYRPTVLEMGLDLKDIEREIRSIRNSLAGRGVE